MPCYIPVHGEGRTNNVRLSPYPLGRGTHLHLRNLAYRNAFGANDVVYYPAHPRIQANSALKISLAYKL